MRGTQKYAAVQVCQLQAQLAAADKQCTMVSARAMADSAAFTEQYEALQAEVHRLKGQLNEQARVEQGLHEEVAELQVPK